ncbi:MULTISPECIES: hypothetical protein [unclassified Burkholderia]|uniref:hypothetical protein n=1 Tax=unclassified Burkholderia TaxID=2613784 RepID=UPI000F5A9F74|nr:MULTISPECIES: hypothetical protein [unclassified Burkholderia]RQR33922.1 hypothetical protein DIE20_29440 [Burkholderia sp. Bp9131]RQR66592.1 hypothetical protein DIE12_30880 [Burkholderia sp. Bp9015]RQR92915.1 hypothetical protein DIE04_22800 [Burkholderia sp. Bp8994]RQS20352.1 hypothetical protein DIE05_33500 [Burkholderia sp. Bp8995]RQS37637.1 hypothetical protein DIE01_22740 [Burkholderia sp. Bp8990]
MISKRGRCLSVVLLEDIDFLGLVEKIENAFGARLSVKDKKGRCIADWDGDDFSIEVVDRVDRLADFLSDGNHIVDVFIESDENFNEKFEGKIKSIFKNGGVAWGRAVWSQVSRDESLREIYPDSD